MPYPSFLDGEAEVSRNEVPSWLLHREGGRKRENQDAILGWACESPLVQGQNDSKGQAAFLVWTSCSSSLAWESGVCTCKERPLVAGKLFNVNQLIQSKALTNSTYRKRGKWDSLTFTVGLCIFSYQFLDESSLVMIGLGTNLLV